MAGPGIKNEKERLIEEILITNYEKYYRLAYGYVHNDADAMDIVQEGAYKAILKSETLREPAYAATWVYRIMLNEVFQFCRDNAKRRAMKTDPRRIGERRNRQRKWLIWIFSNFMMLSAIWRPTKSSPPT